jgi:hypothetical protein
MVVTTVTAEPLARVAEDRPLPDEIRAILVAASSYLAAWARPGDVVVLAETDPAPTTIPRTDPAVLLSPLIYAQYMEDVGGDLNEIPDSIRKAAALPPPVLPRNLVADDLDGKLHLQGDRSSTPMATGRRSEKKAGPRWKRPVTPRFIVKVAWPVVSADRTDALVALQVNCGTRCGSTWWLALRKDSQSGQWHLIRKYELPLSAGPLAD